MVSADALRSREAGIDAFKNFCSLYNLPDPFSPLPHVNAARLELFALWAWGNTECRPSTISQYLSSARFAMRTLHGPAAVGPVGREALIVRLAQRAETRPTLEKAPATLELLRALHDLQQHGLISVHVRAACLVAYACFMRASEYCKTDPDYDRCILKAGDVAASTRRLRVTIRVRKNNPEHFPHVLCRDSIDDATIDPVRAYLDHLAALPFKLRADMPAFTRPDGQPVSSAQVSRALKMAAALVGIDPTTVGPHSLRIGAASAAKRMGLPAITIQQEGLWFSEGGPVRYQRGAPEDTAYITADLFRFGSTSTPARRVG